MSKSPLIGKVTFFENGRVLDKQIFGVLLIDKLPIVEFDLYLNNVPALMTVSESQLEKIECPEKHKEYYQGCRALAFVASGHTNVTDRVIVDIENLSFEIQLTGERTMEQEEIAQAIFEALHYVYRSVEHRDPKPTPGISIKLTRK